MRASGLDTITQRFSSCIMGKGFGAIDELSVVGESFTAAFDKMKSLITDDTIQIEQKGIDTIVVENYFNLIATTNHKNSIKLDEGDRRYCCLEVSDCHKQDTSCFKRFIEVLDNQNAGNHLYTYFLNYEESEMVDLRKIPMTEIKRDL